MKKQNMTICMTILIITASSGYGGITTYTDLAAFEADANATVVDDFTGEGWDEFVTHTYNAFSTPYTINGITYTDLVSSTLGLVIKEDVPNHYDIQSQSRTITRSGQEDFTLDFANETHAVGFDSYANGLGPLMVTFFGESGSEMTYDIQHDPLVLGFFGVVSDEPIVSMRWTATLGGSKNTGIGRIRTDAVPEPATLLLLGMGGMMIRKRK